jgi:CHAT domain-containing protein
MRWFALLLLLSGCARSSKDLDSEFAQARASLQDGDLDKAIGQADHGFRQAVLRQDVMRQWRFRFLRCDILAMSHRAEEIVLELADPIPQTPAYAGLAARKLMLEGQAQSLLSNQAGAEALLDRARQAAEAANAQDVLVETDIIRGPIVAQLRGAEQGERILVRALKTAQASHAHFSEANILMNLGVIRSRKNRWEEAANLFEQALAVSETRWKILYPAIQNNLAVCYQNLGDFDRAIAIQRAAIALDERTGAKVYLLGALRSIGESYLNQRKFREAIPYLKRALTLYGEMGSASEGALSAGNLANVYIELGDWPNAEALNQTAIRLKQSAKSQTLYYNRLNAGRIAAGKGDPDQAVRLYKQVLSEAKDDPSAVWEAHMWLGVAAAGRQDSTLAAQEFETAVELVERTRADMLRTEFKLPFLTRVIELYQRYVDTLLAQGRVEQALAVADSSRAQVLAERSGAAPARRLAPGSFSRIAAASGTVLLSYWLTPAQSHVWVVTAREIHHVVLPGAAQLEPLVAQYKEATERQLADPLRTPLAAGEKLYEMLIAPVRQYVPAGSRVVVVPDGVLHGLNLEALPVPGATPHYFISDATVEVAPSLSSAAAQTGNRPRASRLLLLGDAITNDPNFPALADAAREIAAVSGYFAQDDRSVLIRESATPQAFLAAASGPLAAIHFTAHAVANRDSPLESAVLLSGGKLYARDVMDLPLHADLVTVSACRGAGQRAYSGEGLVGFAWAFLHAGARHVIAGLWDVNDQSTAGLMNSLYRELAAGKRPADALRTAKLAMIESKGNLKKPYYWAPFQLYTVAP